MRRPPAVAAQFYPGDPRVLRQTVESLVDRGAAKVPAQAVLVPHAGYVYSGGCAGRTFSAVELPERFIILCPNHTGLGSPLATDDADGWDTPLGPVPLDRDLVQRLLAHCAALVPDSRSHAREHALEVQLPFLQVLRPQGFSFVPICVGTGDLAALFALGEAMAEAVEESGQSVLIVISSDMTHYESAASARIKDRRALTALERVDPGGLHEVVRRERISMCGYAPAVAGLAAVRRRGATTGSLVQYTHSGVVTGDDREVVAYAGMVFA